MFFKITTAAIDYIKIENVTFKQVEKLTVKLLFNLKLNKREEKWRSTTLPRDRLNKWTGQNKIRTVQIFFAV